jgi:AcrR family transcriptional regulator
MPRQARARATVEAMIEATARILTAEGPDALNTNRIAEVAGVSVGSLYQYFPSKEALVALVMEVELERDRAAMAEQLQHAAHLPLDQLLQASVRANAQRFYQRAAIHRRSASPKFERSESPGADSAKPINRAILPMVSSVERWDTVRNTVRELRAALVATLASRPDELRPEYSGPDGPQRLDVAALVVFAAMEAAYNEAMCHAPDYLLRDDFADHLITLCRAILLRPT